MDRPVGRCCVGAVAVRGRAGELAGEELPDPTSAKKGLLSAGINGLIGLVGLTVACAGAVAGL